MLENLHYNETIKWTKGKYPFAPSIIPASSIFPIPVLPPLFSYTVPMTVSSTVFVPTYVNNVQGQRGWGQRGEGFEVKEGKVGIR